MAYLELKEQTRLRARIKSALKLRGLYMDIEDEWEKHGPHYPEMQYQVYIGRAYESVDTGSSCTCFEESGDCARHKGGFWVVIYPKGVYWIDDPDDWWKIIPENKIPVGLKEIAP